MFRLQALTLTVATAFTLGVGMSGAIQAQEVKKTKVNREYYELRRYTFASAEKAKAFEPYLKDALVPALKRAGAGPIGMFVPQEAQAGPLIIVLITHKNMTSVTGLPDKLAADTAYQTAAKAMFDQPQSDPAYLRIESTLLSAFEGLPKAVVPAKKTRMFELRTYESQNDKAAKAKIHMFNEAEIGIFNKTGLRPVFFGEAIVGQHLPNLTYMLVFDDMTDHDKTWGAFGADPDWQKLRVQPGYTDKDTVSHIDRIFLNPLEFSEI